MVNITKAINTFHGQALCLTQPICCHTANFELPFHFIEIYLSVSVDIIHAEGPGQFLLCRTRRCDMERQHKLSEVNGAASIRIEGSEDIFTEFLCISTGEDLGVHFYKLSLGQFPIWAIL